MDNFIKELEQLRQQIKDLSDELRGALIVHENAHEMLEELKKARQSVKKASDLANGK